MSEVHEHLSVMDSAGDFNPLVECRSAMLTRLSLYVIRCFDSDKRIERNVLSMFVQETRRTEEFLDAYGAKHNTWWGPFRALVAAGKFASDALYKTLHLKYAAPYYHLLAVDGDFLAATDHAVDDLSTILVEICRAFLNAAVERKLRLPDTPYDEFCPESELPLFALPWDAERRINPEAGRTVVNIATAFLNQVESSDIIGTFRATRERSLEKCVPDLFSERRLRWYENESHNLQAIYDTALTGTDTEQADNDLPYLRGHITVVFHLLEIATSVSHYYERHVRFCSDEASPVTFLTEERTRTLLFDYSLDYVVRYLEKARELCRTLLQRYAEIAEIEIPVPVYRGFHVRPSSLVAKIVLHYGTSVTLMLEGDECDASSAMDIIRFNEKIYATKRRRLAEDVARITDRIGGEELMPVFLALLEEEKIVLYSGDLQLDDFPRVSGETFAEYANRGVARLLATGKIDIRTDIHVTLRGDIRVLEDIRILARHGYGEDSMGNNVTLPVELSYLRR